MKKRGKGMGAVFYGTGYGNGFPDVSTARMRIDSDGQVKVYIGATEVGQGLKTILCQITGQVLGLRGTDIQLFSEDTSHTPDAGTAAASRQTYNSGNAVKKAAETMKEMLLKKAQNHLHLNAMEGLTMANHWIYLKTFPQKRVHFRDLIEGEELFVEESFIAQTVEMDAETGEGAPYWPYTFGCYGVEVEVDTTTGIVEIVRAVCAQDVGKAINPELIEGQIDGGFAMGLGYGLMEDLNVVQGEIKHNRFSKYLIPTALDMPDLERIIIEAPSSTGPFGAKGIGEPVMIPVVPAILNAIHDAIGIRFYEIPVTPERVLIAINEAERKDRNDVPIKK